MRIDGRDKGCVVVNVDPVTGRRDPTVLRAITAYRETRLGGYGSTTRPGRIAVGDSVVLQMFAPVPLALAAPITLALRALPASGRRRLAAALHSRSARVVAHPLVAFGLFVATPSVLYYSPLYEATLRNEWLHNLNHVHFLAVGMLLYVTLLGLDPLPNPLPYVYRFLMIAAVGVSHVLLGIPIMMGPQLGTQHGRRPADRRCHPVAARRSYRARVPARVPRPVGPRRRPGGPPRRPATRPNLWRGRLHTALVARRTTVTFAPLPGAGPRLPAARPRDREQCG
jgi:hypothetical protein